MHSLRDELKKTMFEYFGVFREGNKMEKGLKKLLELKATYPEVYINNKSPLFNHALIYTLELEGLFDIAEAVARGAIARQESRGSHSRVDYPERDDEKFLYHTIYRLKDGKPVLESLPVRLGKIPGKGACILMKLKVFRFDRETGESHYDTFEIEPSTGMTVLSALFKIQEELDDSLAFRYSCRGAVCGSCAMLINRIPGLACRTRIEPLLKGEGKIKLRPFSGMEDTVSWNPENEVLVEPLPSLPKVKDLIVDMDKFFEFYRAVEPTFKPASKSS